MTLQELAERPGTTVGTREAAEILGVSRYGLNIAAKAGKLGLPYVFTGNRLKISKAALLEFCGYKSEKDGDAPGKLFKGAAEVRTG